MRDPTKPSLPQSEEPPAVLKLDVSKTKQNRDSGTADAGTPPLVRFDENEEEGGKDRARDYMMEDQDESKSRRIRNSRRRSEMQIGRPLGSHSEFLVRRAMLEAREEE